MTALAAGGYRMRANTRKLVLLVHILSACVWIGVDVAMAVLIATLGITDDIGTKEVAAQALVMFAVWPMVIAGVASLATGVWLGLGTKYGLVRYWWVAVKLVANVVLVALILLLLRPGLIELAERGRAAVGEATGVLGLNGMIAPPIVSLTALTGAMILSVFKPWGRLARDGRRDIR